MAYGDLVGDLATAYLTPAQRAAALIKGSGAQSLSELGGAASGPVSRAQQQLPVAGLQTAGQGPVQPQPTPVSLADAYANPSQFAKSPQAPTVQSLATLGTVGVTPTASSPTYPTASQLAAPLKTPSLGDALSASTTPAAAVTGAAGLSLADIPNAAPPADSFRPTDVNSTSPSGTIVMRAGANGVPEFSNQPSDLASAANYTRSLGGLPAPTSLAQLAPGDGRSPDPSASLASLGSAANLGDGIGTFSQAQPGDAALAAGRFQRANDLRAGYRAEDRLENAQAAATRANNTTIVRDSSQPLTRADLAQAQLDRQDQQARLENINQAQGALGALQQQQAGELKNRQAARLEDLQTAATALGATPEQQAALQRAIDPTGEKALARQLTQAQIGNTNASAEKSRADAEKAAAEANGTAPGAQDKAAKAKLDAQLAQLEIDRRKTEATNTAKSLTDQKAGSIDIAREARDLANGISKDKRFPDVVGPVNSRLPTLDGDSQDLINRANRLQSLLTLDNLKLMSGVLTDKDIDFLGRIGSGLNVTDGGIKGSVQGTKSRLSDIASKLNTKISDYDKANPAKPAATPQGSGAPQTAAASPVQISTEAAYAALPSGAEYIDPAGNHRSKP
jgi:hypothetical protein